MEARTFVFGVVVAGALLVRPLAGQQPDGQAVYRQECKLCHGINGVPPKREQAKYKKLKSLGDSGFVSALSVDSIVTILKKGLGKDMKSFTGKLTDGEICAVAEYIKKLAEKKRPT